MSRGGSLVRRPLIAASVLALCVLLATPGCQRGAGAMKRRTLAYRRRGRWLISTEARTVDSFWISTAPFVDAGAGPDNERLAEAGPDAVLRTVDDIDVAELSTDSSGGFLFRSLDARLYTVVVDAATIPTGCLPTSASNSLDINLATGEDVRAVTFGCIAQESQVLRAGNAGAGTPGVRLGSN